MAEEWQTLNAGERTQVADRAIWVIVPRVLVERQVDWPVGLDPPAMHLKRAVSEHLGYNRGCRSTKHRLDVRILNMSLHSITAELATRYRQNHESLIELISGLTDPTSEV